MRTLTSVTNPSAIIYPIILAVPSNNQPKTKNNAYNIHPNVMTNGKIPWKKYQPYDHFQQLPDAPTPDAPTPTTFWLQP